MEFVDLVKGFTGSIESLRSASIQIQPGMCLETFYHFTLVNGRMKKNDKMKSPARPLSLLFVVMCTSTSISKMYET